MRFYEQTKGYSLRSASDENQGRAGRWLLLDVGYGRERVPTLLQSPDESVQSKGRPDRVRMLRLHAYTMNNIYLHAYILSPINSWQVPIRRYGVVYALAN